MLDPVLQANKGDGVDVLARLTQIRALELQGQSDSAKAQLAALASHLEVKRTPFFRILLADAAFRLAEKKAQTLTGVARTAALSQAYQPYLDLLADNSLDADQREGFGAVLHQRWAALYAADKDLTSLPTVVLQGIGTIMLADGKQFLQQAADAQKTNYPKAASLTQQAKAKLAGAQDSFAAILKIKGIAAPIQAQAIFNLGLATYYLDHQSPETIFKVTDLCLRPPRNCPPTPRQSTRPSATPWPCSTNCVNTILLQPKQLRAIARRPVC